MKNQQVENPQDATLAADTPKRTFVEPSISSPVDVLEATTFFQAVESGGTGLRGKKLLFGGGGD